MGNKKVGFQLNDEIFSLEGPINKKFSQETQCYVCDKELRRSHKLTCQFCGHKACEKCAYKLRVFANQQSPFEAVGNMALSEITRVMQMGICCRICDRKFFLRASY